MGPKLHLTVVPAYGRDYITGKAAEEDWLAGKEFKVEDHGPRQGQYISIRDAADMEITIRFNRKRNVVRVG
jgi:hypothetical protein